MKCAQFVRAVIAMTVAWLAASAILQADVATTPEERPIPEIRQRYEQLNARIKRGNVDLVFIGDSITHGWEANGSKVWNKYYAKRNAANLGISGDETQHVLWRLDHGNIDGISPKLAVVMIGTNNASAEHPPAEIAAGIKAIVERLRTKLPQTKVLLLGIFPRGPDNNDRLRAINAKTNTIAAKLADNKTVFYLNIGPKFLQPDGSLSKDISPDLVHLSSKGYTIWAEAIEPTVAKLMGEKVHN